MRAIQIVKSLINDRLQDYNLFDYLIRIPLLRSSGTKRRKNRSGAVFERQTKPVSLPARGSTYYTVLFLLAFAFPQVLHAQVMVIRTDGTGNTKEQHAIVAMASANVKTAIQFLRYWGWTNEADNIQQYFEKNKLHLDLDATEAAKTTNVITLGGIKVLCADKGNSNIWKKTDPQKPEDFECIAELAFTMVHEKVHTHQSYAKRTLDLQTSETEAYNKEIADEDTTLVRMADQLDLAKKERNKAREKELWQWMDAVITVKINAIEEWKSRYPETTKQHWPDALTDRLRRISDLIDDRIKQFNVQGGVDTAHTELRTLINELNVFERAMPARQMPEYWMRLNKNPEPYVEVETNQILRTITFHTPHGEVIASLPYNIKTGESISGSVRTQTTGADPNRSTDQTQLDGYAVRINEHKVNVTEKNLMLVISDNDIKNGLSVSLNNNKGNMIGLAVISLHTAKTNTDHPANPSSDNFRLPSIATQGDPMEITGPFDGNFKNTECKIEDQPVQVIAESPGRLVIMNPVNVKGPTSITLKEGNIEKKSTFNTLRLQLNVSKTTLIKGEQAVVTVQVEGLQELKKTVFVRLETDGMVKMKGGNRQVFTIRPKDVRAGGVWTQTRMLTGLQSGTFQLTSTIDDME